MASEASADDDPQEEDSTTEALRPGAGQAPIGAGERTEAAHEADDATDEVARAPERAKPLLPPPASLLKGGATAKPPPDFREARSEPLTTSPPLPAAPPPPGTAPPIFPTPVHPADTISFINEVALDLINQHEKSPENEATPSAEEESSEAASTSPSETSTASSETSASSEAASTRSAEEAAAITAPTASDASEPVAVADLDAHRSTAANDPPSWRKLAPWLAGAAAIVLFVAFAAGGDEQVGEKTEHASEAVAEASTARGTLAAASAKPTVAEQRTAPTEPPTPTIVDDPQALALAELDAPVEAAEDLGDAVEAVDGVPTDDVEAQPPAEDPVPEAAATPTPAPAKPSTPAKKSGRRATSKSNDAPAEPPRKADAAPSPAPPKPAPKPAQNQSPEALLKEAQSALSSGQAGTAYRLAAQSHKMKRSHAALRIMVRAACRTGNENNAKSAFRQLPVADRSGIRAECRKHGVRLGL